MGLADLYGVRVMVLSGVESPFFSLIRASTCLDDLKTLAGHLRAGTTIVAYASSDAADPKLAQWSYLCT